MGPNTGWLTWRLWLWLVPAAYRTPEGHRTAPSILPCKRKHREEAASYRAARAVWEAISGNDAEAKRNAMAALDLSKGRDVEYAAGLALAFSGDTSRSEALAGDLEKRFPEDTFAKFTYVPVLRALAVLEHGKPVDSVESLQITLRYELAANGLNFSHHYLGGLHSAYVRGEALIAEHRYCGSGGRVSEDSRSSRYRGRWIPSARWRTCNSVECSLYRETRPKRKLPMSDFLALWKNADPDVPILKTAKAEYSRL